MTLPPNAASYPLPSARPVRASIQQCRSSSPQARPKLEGPARVLCFHPYSSNSAEFRKRFELTRKKLKDVAPEGQWTYLDGPVKLEEGGHAWWQKVRNPEQKEEEGSFLEIMSKYEGRLPDRQYKGLEELQALIRDAELKHGPFHAAVGFSQGAVALAGAVGCGLLPHLRCAVLMSGFVPRDPSLRRSEKIDLPTLHVYSDQDAIVPSALSAQLTELFTEPKSLLHDKGHVAGLGAEGRTVVSEFIRTHLVGGS
eukprot:Hpha_TRINITY_DN9330_c0_g1::TRINITY_DN9330_c0_g1_i2::g.26134::m.26134